MAVKKPAKNEDDKRRPAPVRRAKKPVPSSGYPAMSLSELIGAFKLAAKKNRAAALEASARNENRQFDIIVNIYRELRRRRKRHVLIALLHDADPGVRGRAAARVLEFEPDSAVPVLRALARTEPFPMNFDAKMTLKVWNAGELNFS